VKKWQEQSLQILNKKAHDYASEDMLSNFKKTAEMCKVTPEKVFEIMLCIKICRIVELQGGKTAQNESLDDTLMDLANYATLNRAYLYEKSQEAKG
jgi:hypothetical protein